MLSLNTITELHLDSFEVMTSKYQKENGGKIFVESMITFDKEGMCQLYIP